MASASAPAPARAAPGRCRPLASGASGSLFTIGKASPRSGVDAEEPEPAQPFAVEIGDAVAFGQGFAVAALESTGEQTHARIVTLPADAARGKVTDLGRVQGDVEPPQLAPRGADVFFALTDHDTVSARLRLGKLTDAAGSAQLAWGFQTPRSGRGA
ncbi:MAG TPA: hypothetical protein VK524_29025, partial [Polyangiaceae bacterium]|nr:hypothetical protein [Polyangiaceae bacterium]